MPQQINLYRPILLTQPRHFSARTLVQALALLTLGIAVLCAWTAVQNAALGRALQATSRQQDAERQALQRAIAANPGAAASTASLEQGLQSLQRRLAEREQALAELMRGRIVDGRSHSARLRLIARTVPASAWLDEIAMQGDALSLSGRTLDPSALKPWIAALAGEPLLAGQSLTALKVDQAGDDWRFTLAQSGVRP
jgi:Tfp pilus assembly protein PilN